MKTLHILLSLAVLLCAVYRVSCEDYEYEDEVSAPVQKAAPPPPPRGLSALQRSARGPVIGRPQPKTLTKATTSTTTPEPPPGDEYDDEQLVDEEEGGSEEHPTTTTEAAKKGTVLKGGVVRPFRSNTDLLETLKRRRAQHGQQVVSTTHAPSTQQASDAQANNKFKNNASGRRNKIADQTGSNSNPKSSTTNASGASASSSSSGRRFSPRGGQRAEASSQEPTSSEETQTTRTSRLFAGRGRRF